MQPRPRSIIALALSLALAAPAFAADKPAKPDKETAPRYPVPEGLRGFSGTLGGTVVSVQDHMHGFVLKVTQILHSNAGSTAKDPKSAIGQEVEITPTTTKNKDGHWVANDEQLHYIKSLKKGQDIQIDVLNTDPGHLRISELTKSEKQQAEHQKKESEK